MMRRKGNFGFMIFALAVVLVAGAQRATSQGRPAVEPGASGSGAPTDADALGHGFEVATVKPANRNDGRRWFGTKVAPSGRLMVSAMSLEGLVYYAYVGTQKVGSVEGGPKWVDSDEWDIEAKLDDADMDGWDKLTDIQRMDRVRPQLRALLVERFAVKLHTETKVTPVYALVQAKGGVKMKEVEAPPDNADPQDEEDRMRSKKDPDGPPAGGFMVSDKGWVGHAVQVRFLTGQIGYEIGATDKMIVDETGLDGHYYDFTIKLTKEKDGPTVEQQIEDGLGLRVQERKVPIQTYVIDDAVKPAEN